MAVAVGGIALIYGALAAVLVAAVVHAVLVHDAALALGGLVFLVAIPYLLRQHHANAAGDVLRLTRARPAPAGDALVPVAQRLAAQADVAPPPDMLVAEAALPNAFAVPTRQTPLIVVTSSLVERLTAEELNAVLAHEMTHLANRDAAVMTFVSGPALGISTMWHEGGRGAVAAAMLSPVWLVGVLLMRAVSRYREYTADRGSGLLTGTPEQLMSALTKIHDVQPTGDLHGGRVVSALCIRGFASPWLSLLRDHPPLEKRLARLAAMSRVQGEPVGP